LVDREDSSLLDLLAAGFTLSLHACLPGWLAGWLAGGLDGWVAGWLLGWLAGLLAGWAVSIQAFDIKTLN
jgi:hypothetical protein